MQNIYQRQFFQTSIPDWIKQPVVILFASFILSAFALISIPLPFSPVPIVLQGSCALFIGALLGSKRGALAVLTFLMQGCLGLPVFAGGAFGFACLFGPTGGYLVGFVAGAFITGLIAERAKDEVPSLVRVFTAMALGNGVLFLFGISYLTTFLGVKMALLVGLLPFIPGDLLKLMLFTKFYKKFSWLKA
ncbi:MAG: biotin transporter BioY [Simkaniaceae bacterium]|nr:biotin transporter BioY [Simkaniaceae bacterium]